VKRRLILLLALSCFAIPGMPQDVEPIRIEVGAGPSLKVTIPNVAKGDVTVVLSTFFSRGDEKAKKRFTELIGRAKSVTLVVTTGK
jgi:hypothetical protein